MRYPKEGTFVRRFDFLLPKEDQLGKHLKKAERRRKKRRATATEGPGYRRPGSMNKKKSMSIKGAK